MAEAGVRRLVWDVPTRLFHWGLAALIAFSWWSAEYDHMDWHGTSGLVILALLVFRILWGLFGTSTARFSQFVKGPRAVWAYVRPGERGRVATIGHNPLGTWSVVALLLVLIVQVVSGLFAVDVDGIESGPLSPLVDFDQGRAAAAVHHLSWNAVLVLVALHVAAILFYLLARRRNLTWTMLTGHEPVAPDAAPGAIRAPWWRLLGAAVAAAAIAWWVSRGLRLR